MADQNNAPQPSPHPMRLGFGASGAWSKRWFSEAKAHRLIEHALDQGITHFDTASFYAGGLAEIRLGKALLALGRQDVEVSTKTGTHYHSGRAPTKDFSDANIRKDVEQSLTRLGREQLDILYLHGPTHQEIDASLKTLNSLKAEGKIRLSGVCGFKPSLAHAIETEQFNAIMGTYNVADLSHIPEFKRAKAQGMRTIGIASLVPGLGNKSLTRPKSFADIWYLLRAVKHNRPSMAQARERLHDITDRYGHPSAEHVMLGFALSEPNIDMVLTNTTRIAHLEANIATAQSTPLPPDLLAELEHLAQSLSTGI